VKGTPELAPGFFLPWRWAVAVSLAVALALLPFLPGLYGPFLHDDLSNLPKLVVGPFSWDALLDVAVRNESGPFRRPIANMLLATNYWLHGFESPFGFKVGNLIIHGMAGIAAGWLAFWLLRLLAPTASPDSCRFAAALVALIWLVHPIQISTVHYVVQRMAQLSTLFTFLALGSAARTLSLLPERPSFAYVAAGLTTFITLTALATLSKENGVLVLPLAAAILFVWLATLPLAQRRGRLRQLRPVVYPALILPIVAAATFLALRPGFVLGAYAGRDFSLVERVFTQFVVMWKYLGIIVWPQPSSMSLFHEVTTRGSHSLEAWIAGALLAALAVSALLAARRFPVWSVAVLFFLTSHALESTVFALEMMYEHRNYTALFGPALLAGYGIQLLRQRFPPVARIGWLLPLVLLSGLTLQRSVDWSDMTRFYSREYRNHPDSFRAILGAYVLLKMEGGSQAEIDTFERRILERRDGLIWTAMLEAGKQCEDPGYPADWDKVEARIRAAVRPDRMVEFTHLLTNRVLSGTCEGLDRQRFAGMVELGYRHGLAAGSPAVIEEMARMRAWLYRNEGDIDQAIDWFWRASAARPQAVEALFDAAYLLLNADRVEQVERVVEELQRRERATRLPIGYRLREVEGHLTTLKEEQSAGRLNSPATVADD